MARPSARSFAALAFLLCFAALPALAAERTAIKRYALAGIGYLELRVPAGWVDIVRQPFNAPGTAPTIGFWQTSGPAFEITVTPEAQPSAEGKSATEASLRERVERFASEVKANAVEPVIELVRFEGRSGPGFYFSATDKAPGPNDYKFVTQGAVKVDQLVVTFTILSNDAQGQTVKDALEMLESTTRAAQ